MYFVFFPSLSSQCYDYLHFLPLEANPDVGVVGPKQISSDGRISHGGIVGSNISPQHSGWLEPDKPAAIS